MKKSDFPIKKAVIALIGPTAIGKTALSLALAKRFNCEIVSVDSMQVYRYMDIGTAKVSRQERDVCPHHLIDIVDPDDTYDSNRFITDALHAIAIIHSKNKIPLLVGGTGLYLKSLVIGLFENEGDFSKIRDDLHQRLEKEGRSKLHEELMLFDSNSAKRIHKNDTQRLLRALEIFYGTGVPWSEHLRKQEKESKIPRFANILQLGLTCDRQTLYERINLRTTAMLDAGLRQEVENLLAMGYSSDLKSMQSIGYRHMFRHLENHWSFDEMHMNLARDTRHYAKRQYTWFKKMNIEWFDVNNLPHIENRIRNFLEN